MRLASAAKLAKSEESIEGAILADGIVVVVCWKRYKRGIFFSLNKFQTRMNLIDERSQPPGDFPRMSVPDSLGPTLLSIDPINPLTLSYFFSTFLLAELRECEKKMMENLYPCPRKTTLRCPILGLLPLTISKVTRMRYL